MSVILIEKYLVAYAGINFSVLQQQRLQLTVTVVQDVHQRRHAQIVLRVDIYIVMVVVENQRGSYFEQSLLAGDVEHCLPSLRKTDLMVKLHFLLFVFGKEGPYRILGVERVSFGSHNHSFGTSLVVSLEGNHRSSVTILYNIKT